MFYSDLFSEMDLCKPNPNHQVVIHAQHDKIASKRTQCHKSQKIAQPVNTMNAEKLFVQIAQSSVCDFNLKLGVILSAADAETVWNAFRLANFSRGKGDEAKSS
jgi:hypothetical protein